MATWPDVAGAMLPAAAAVCAAATGFLLDEPATAATAVTARGGRWAQVARGAVAVLPLATWLTIVATAPAGTHRTPWSVTGLAAQALALTLALLAIRRGSVTPGAAVASAIAGLTLMPFVIGPMLGWNGF